ncbi:hypothetical protein AB0J83_00460 [Actinoplanes sp. NPDC049596]|uniref:hypothetical protein n=1 Tax=unclassified Actinoplanes TaxID=2626549 RepID=UPI003421C23B
MKRALILVILLAIGLAVFARCSYRPAPEAARPVAGDPLRADAAAIDEDRRAGNVAHFALVPKTPPPGLRRMEAVGDPADDGVTDVYSVGGVRAIVKFTAVPGEHPCGELTCIRDGATGVVSPDAPSLTHVSVALTGEDAQARTFWATTAWMPVGQASWFGELRSPG